MRLTTPNIVALVMPAIGFVFALGMALILRQETRSRIRII
jgi:hypothetical protein